MSDPWMKFYPTDWRADPALRMCSLGARGLWMEMLCIMHEAEPRGTLRVNGKALNARQMAVLVGSSVEEISPLMAELESCGVFSRDENGVLFSRRMMRDDEKAARDKANGRKGGNPKLSGGVNPPDNPPDKGKDNGQDKAHMPEARYQKEEGSVAKATGGSPRATSDSIETVWDEGVSGLKAMGVSDRDARSNVGRWMKATGNDAEKVLSAIQRARDHGTRDPIPLVGRIISPLNSGKSDAQADRSVHDYARALEERFREQEFGSGAVLTLISSQ